jgi:hypothetical protein
MDTSWIDDEEIEESILEKEAMNEIQCYYVYVGIDQNIRNVTKKVQNLEIYPKQDDYRIIPRDQLLQMIHSNKTYQSKKHRLLEILLYNVDSPSSESLLAVGDELSFTPLRIPNTHGNVTMPNSSGLCSNKATFRVSSEEVESPLPNTEGDRRSPEGLGKGQNATELLTSKGALHPDKLEEPSALRTVTTMDEILIPPSLCIFHETNCLYFIFQEIYQDRDNQMTKPILKIMSDVLPRIHSKKTKKVAFKEDIRHTKKRITN